MKRMILLLVVMALGFGAQPTVSQAACPPEPHPCGGEWPEGLDGPFELDRVEPVRVTVPLDWSDPDGAQIELDGTLGFPNLPEGVRAPAILISTPYNGRCNVEGHNARWQCFRDPAGRDPITVVGETCPTPDYWDDQPPNPACFEGTDHINNSLGLPPVDLVKQGYVVATFTVRGTGGSGGCFGFGGTNEQRDQKALVDWLAAQHWSNERVGMGGISYMSWTTWQAAVQAPTALKTIVTFGELVDLYQGFHTPQGALSAIPGVGLDAYFAQWSLGNGAASGSYDWIGRACPESIASFSTRTALEYGTEIRDRAYYEERSLLSRMDDVEAAVLSTHGFSDGLVHGYQDSMLWDLLPQVPKRFIRGWWGHMFPSNFYEGAATSPDGRDYEPLNAAWSEPEWRSILIRWLGYWLKGIGTPGRIDVMDSSAAGPGGPLADWVSSSHGWSNPEEVLYLASSSLKPSPGGDSATFRDAPIAGPDSRIDGLDGSLYCGDRLRRVVYETAPLDDDVAIVGNPYMYLNLSSDMPGGIVDVTMVTVPPGFDCSKVGSRRLRMISMGTADLRFHDSPYVGRDFPTHDPTHVRIDLTDLAMRVPTGHRIAIVVSRGEHTGVGIRWHRNGRAQDMPQITIHAGDEATASHIVLPIADGTLGGSAPTIAYPPRPFMPAS